MTDGIPQFSLLCESIAVNFRRIEYLDVLSSI